MTRINTVDPDELCDQHLWAEYRELPRIPNAILHNRISLENVPEKYTVRTEGNPDGGKGHVRFFVDKLDWLYWRYMALIGELRRRGYDPKNKWPSDIIDVPYVLLWCSWNPDKEAIELNRKRIKERMPKRPRYAGRYVTM